MAGACPKVRIQCLRSISSARPSRLSHKSIFGSECQSREFHRAPILFKKQVDAGRRVKRTRDRWSEEAEEFEERPTVFSVDDLEPHDRAEFESRSPTEKETYIQEANDVYDYLNSSQFNTRLQAQSDKIMADFDAGMPLLNFPRIKTPPSLFNEQLKGEERDEAGVDDEYEGNDMNELGHADLDRHREMRHYARLAAWEMPLLTNLAKPFEPPDREHILRFRYTTYMGEDLPAGKKIVVEFCTKDLPGLTEAQRIKLIKLLGTRYNPEKDLVKMSCESFETQAQNKRYLGDLVDNLMAEARNDQDMFEDVPLDFRHHRFQRQPQFPDAWKLNVERAKQLETERRLRLDGQGVKEINNKVVDGSRIIEQAVAVLAAQAQTARPLLETARRQAGKKGKQPLR